MKTNNSRHPGGCYSLETLITVVRKMRITDNDVCIIEVAKKQLKGDKQNMWSVTVNGNWRMTFYFEGQDAYLVDYMDYY